APSGAVKSPCAEIRLKLSSSPWNVSIAATSAPSGMQSGFGTRMQPTMRAATQPSSTSTSMLTSADASTASSGPSSFVGVYVTWTGTVAPGTRSARSYENATSAPMSTARFALPLTLKAYDAHVTASLRLSEIGNAVRNPRRTCSGGGLTTSLAMNTGGTLSCSRGLSGAAPGADSAAGVVN